MNFPHLVDNPISYHNQELIILCEIHVEMEGAGSCMENLFPPIELYADR